MFICLTEAKVHKFNCLLPGRRVAPAWLGNGLLGGEEQVRRDESPTRVNLDDKTSMIKPNSTSIFIPGSSWWSPPCEETELIRTSFSPGVATSSLFWESSLILLMQNRFTNVCCIFPYLQSRVHWRGSCSSGSPGGVSPHLFTTKLKTFSNCILHPLYC